MNRTLRRLFAITTAFLIILSSACVFAAEQAGVENTVEGPKAVKEVKKTSSKKGLKAEEKKAEKSKELKSGEYYTAPTRTYNTTGIGSGFDAYFDGTSAYSVYSIAVKTSGKLFVDAGNYSDNSYSVSIVVGTFDGSQITYYGKTAYIAPGETDTFIGGPDVKAGNTYWVGVRSSKAGYALVKPYVVSYATRSLPAGKTMLTSGRKGSAATTALFKIKATKTGFISVGLMEYGSSTSAGHVTLLNSKKKAISDKLWYYDASKTSYVVFGVKKGTTYYLKCNLNYGSYSNGYTYGVAWKNYAAAYKKNLKKGKALKLKRKGKAANMARPATGKKMNQWYKFKVPKKGKTVIKVNAGNIKSGKAKMTFYYGKKKIASTTISKGAMNTITLTYGTTYGKANKGTYYAVLTTNAKCSGQYKIQYAK